MESDKYNFIASICYVFDSRGRVLLQKKSRGFGQGKWNGPGGKKEPWEDIEESVKREVREETGLKILDPSIRGELDFVFPRQEERFFSYVFLVQNFQGEARDRGEGELKWFEIEDIPLEKMWDDDRYWLKRLLGGEYIKMKFYFDDKGKVKRYEDLSDDR